jgi:hypothetical protein
MEALIKGVCDFYGVGTLRELVTEDGLTCSWQSVDEFQKVRGMVQKVNEWVFHYKFTRAVCTLTSLERAIVIDFKGQGAVQKFGDLQLGPLLVQPAVLQLFPGASGLQSIPNLSESDFYSMAWNIVTASNRRMEFEHVGVCTRARGSV